MTLTVAIAGRPNVGKSTLFNRLIGKQMAIVSDESGVTRDWREGDGQLFNLKFRALDTAGLEDIRIKGSIASRMAHQTKLALEQTDVVVLVVDGRLGLTADDKAVARELRKTGKPIILVANKCEGTYLPEKYDEGAMLGFGDPIAISATHGDGLDDLHAALSKYIEASPEEEKKPRKAKKVEVEAFGDAEITEAEAEEEKRLLVAVVGRPNAGKSTLINMLIGEERMMTGPEPGLTRDAIPISWEYKGKPVRLVDTAGLRKRARVTEKLEKMSGHETLRAIRLAHVVVLVVDANQPFDKQDLIIGHHVVEEGRALIIAVNKWDVVKDKSAAERTVREKVEDSLAQVAGLPIVNISALKGEGLSNLMKAVMEIYQTWNKRIGTGQLNRWLEKMEFDHPPPITAGRRIKLRYMTQVKSRPPTFSLWVNKPVDLPESYKRFLTHGLRDTFDLHGVPIRWQMKKSENPYLEDSSAKPGIKQMRRNKKNKKSHMLRKKDKRVRQTKKQKKI
ncbi:MAG: ribosome biogenesis GTPase Der [Alphaproteobacteria bacterium]